MTNPFDELLAGKDGKPFDLDAFLRMLGQTGEERSPRDHLRYAFEALEATRKGGDPASHTRALANFGAAMKRVRESEDRAGSSDRPTDPDRTGGPDGP